MVCKFIKYLGVKKVLNFGEKVACDLSMVTMGNGDYGCLTLGLE